MNKELKYISSFFTSEFRTFLSYLSTINQDNLSEIRMRINQPIMLDCGEKILFADKIPPVTRADIDSTMALLSDYSLNSIRDKLCKGFIPLRYGCRAGIAGQVIIKNNKVDFQKDISSIVFRIAHEKIGCADKIINKIVSNKHIYNTLIISPPAMGKTTLLRDTARILGNSFNVTIIDERSEIASIYNGAAQFDIGKRTDIINSCPKSIGISIAVRSLSPDVIITDEIGLEEDASALLECATSGVSFIATLHAKNIEDVKKRLFVKPLIDNNVIEKLIILGNSSGVGTIEYITEI